jgi:hypothetical protein
MFGTVPLSDFAPISLPRMKSMMINCITDEEFNHSKKCCNVQTAVETPINCPNSAWSDVTEALKLLVRKEQSHLPDAKFLVIGAIQPEDLDDISRPTIIRTDMVASISWALPFCVVSTRFGRSRLFDIHWLLRTSGGKEMIGSIQALTILAEGTERWRTGGDGCRLPAKLLRGEGQYDFSHGEFVLAKDSEEWRNEYEEYVCRLWEDERQTGMRLIDAEKREGDAAFLSTLPLVEKTPLG